MELRPSIAKIALQCYGLIAVFLLGFEIWAMQGKETSGLIDTATSLIIGTAWLGTLPFLLISSIGTPRILRFDTSGMTIKTLTREKRFDWKQLEAIGPSFHRLIILKFVDEPGFYISSIGFQRKPWLEFRQFLDSNFASKRCHFWIGPYPIFFRN